VELLIPLSRPIWHCSELTAWLQFLPTLTFTLTKKKKPNMLVEGWLYQSH
jgi:hypothetical protein